MLRNRAYLAIPGNGSTEYVFEFSDGFDLTRTVSKTFVMAERGQYITLAYDLSPVPDAVDQVPDEAGSERRRGYHVELGAGVWTREASFKTGVEQENIRWGDGESATGPDNVTISDASGAGVHKEDRADILENVIATTRTDSEAIAYLHYNQWSDGTYGEAGVFGRPMPVAVDAEGVTINTDTQEPSTVEGSINLVHIARFPTKVTDAVNGVLDEVQDFG